MEKTLLTSVSSLCFHCGDPAGKHPIVQAEKTFCCQGCATVFDILHQHQLENYYQVESHPGISPKDKSHQTRYAFLDDAEIADRVIEFQDETGISYVTWRLPQIHCASCLWLLEKLPNLHAGVLSARVNYLKKELNLKFQVAEISLRELAELLQGIGYAPELSLHDLTESKAKPASRRLNLQIGLAGFCFGNIMLLAFPEYFGLSATAHPRLVQFLHYLSLLLALPVLFYSAWDYLKSAFLSLKQGGLNMDVPISLGILAIFGRSAFEILFLQGEGYLDSLAGLVFFLLLGKWFQQKTHERIFFDRSYASYFPAAVTRVKADKEEQISIPDLQVGDELIIRDQELIPADGILMSESATIDYSFVTGESDSVQVKHGAKLKAGGRISGPVAHIALTHEASSSYLMRLWEDAAFQQDRGGKLAEKVAAVSTYFTLSILLIATVSALWWLGESVATALHVFSSVLIIACPCALALSLPFTLGNALRMLARKGLYLKNIAVIERMAAVDHLVFDKTGTLTAKKGAGLIYHGSTLSTIEKKYLRSLVNNSLHPVSQSIRKFVGQGKIKHLDSFYQHVGQGISAEIEGHSLYLGKASWMTEMVTEEIKNISEGTYFSIDGQVKGYFELKQSLRPDVPHLLDQLADGYEMSLISGDNEKDKELLQTVFPPESSLLFGQSPYDKLATIQQCQDAGKTLMMIGDGLNDAGALAKSDVGIAVTEDLSAFSPASDGILDARKISQLKAFLTYAKVSMNWVKAALGLSLLYNLVGLSFAVQGLLSPVLAAILMPLSSISIILLGTLSTWLSARKHLADKSHSLL